MSRPANKDLGGTNTHGHPLDGALDQFPSEQEPAEQLPVTGQFEQPEDEQDLGLGMDDGLPNLNPMDEDS